MLGHALVLAVAVAAGFLAGGGHRSGADLDAGGRFAAVLPTLGAYFVLQWVLLAGGIVWCAGARPAGLRVGLVAGWSCGLVLTAGALLAVSRL